MKTKTIFCTVTVFMLTIWADSITAGTPQYDNNRFPLVQKPYIELPLGTIKAEGWLLEMLNRQRSGMSSQMDVLYPQVMGPRNGWLGGDGDQWERGPYWIDGLLPLAYILDDENLKQKVQPWVEWALASQREDGFFGPAQDYPYEPGIQRDNSADWWPRMVMLKILKQYHSATDDKRVVDFMTRYFRYQLATLPGKPLGNWTFWAEYRACDNMDAVYWLYDITGDRLLLELAELIHKQAYDFTGRLLHSDLLSRKGSIHCVNLAQGIKEPVIYYQQSHDKQHTQALKKGFDDLRHFNGWPNGMYGGDEALHGSDPTQGSELCSAVELMLSLEQALQITGDLAYAEHLERVAFNTLPTQITDDFMARQYFQQANQVMCTRHIRNFGDNHDGTDNVFGLLTGYPCCTSNLHQGWPKFVQNLWYATPDGGLAAMVYSPSRVTAKVSGGVTVEVTEQTHYPMDETVSFTISIKDKKSNSVAFPLHLRIPSWCKAAHVSVNGTRFDAEITEGVAIIDRTWQKGDKVELTLPMHVNAQNWHENSVAIERGPLVYALKIEERWEKKAVPAEESHYGEHYWEVYPESDWNYGLLRFDAAKTDEVFEVVIDREKVEDNYPWNLANAPIEIRAKRAKQIPTWSLYNQSAGPLPWSNMHNTPGTREMPVETITLIPYGCTTLRITEFPVLND